MWLALCAPAAAQTVYKCMGPDGAVFQSTPCGAGQQQERAYGGEAYATTPQRQAQIEREQARAQAVVRRNAGGAGRASTPGRRAIGAIQLRPGQGPARPRNAGSRQPPYVRADLVLGHRGQQVMQPSPLTDRMPATGEAANDHDIGQRRGVGA
ncbi:DUF4124 domain-containing protein [Luteimonas yindakuii]|uniref:DUF4124 domain-containing protein n=1 Tax=Luteimonas yindakuii TaxID=2565782 RepID=UPI003CCE2EF1